MLEGYNSAFCSQLRKTRLTYLNTTGRMGPFTHRYIILCRDTGKVNSTNLRLQEGVRKRKSQECSASYHRFYTNSTNNAICERLLQYVDK